MYERDNPDFIKVALKSIKNKEINEFKIEKESGESFKIQIKIIEVY